jgi:hypothetical protein
MIQAALSDEVVRSAAASALETAQSFLQNGLLKTAMLLQRTH